MSEQTEEFTSPQLTSPLIFISHDTRDAEIAEAFSKLLKGVSAGVLKTFRSSDKKGTDGIVFGEEWYKTIMEKLATASDVVCILTKQSLERPWILYEAGVAKGKRNVSVQGLALGVSLEKAGSGPFYQFQNCDDSEESITKLVLQLCRRSQLLDPDPEIISVQVKAFKESITSLIEKEIEEKNSSITTDVCTDEKPLAMFLEEMKTTLRDIPMVIHKEILKMPDARNYNKKLYYKNLSIKTLNNLVCNLPPSDRLLFFSSLTRDIMPWIYDYCIEIHRYLTLGDKELLYKAVEVLDGSIKQLQDSKFLRYTTGSSIESDFLFDVLYAIEQTIHDVKDKFEDSVLYYNRK